jgi:hypothetical protein
MELLSARKDENQEINAISLDLADASEARMQTSKQPPLIPNLIRLTPSSKLNPAWLIFCTAQQVDVEQNAVS